MFCRVIDNYGDIGVCWRLAQQLVGEHNLAVRLWVDDLAAFTAICHDIDPRRRTQTFAGIEIFRWQDPFDTAGETIEPGDLVIETFACHLPECFVEAMAHKPVPPIWINLDYLSAEAWVSGYHTLPSPHPRLPLTKFFFFPGFDETTGGLLREHDLEAHRRQFLDSTAQRTSFWRRLGLPMPENTRNTPLLISLFTYENPALPMLLKRLEQWAKSHVPIDCLAPMTRTQTDIEAFLGHPIQAGACYRRGALKICTFSWIDQADYDRLLWLCDINFVRGEDSFVRAQWAARPLVWQIYPQSDHAHRSKLDAFLDRYTALLDTKTGARLRHFHLAWNGFETLTAHCIDDWLESLSELRQHAQEWQKNLSKQQDLCSALVYFYQSKAIMRG